MSYKDMTRCRLKPAGDLADLFPLDLVVDGPKVVAVAAGDAASLPNAE